MLLLNAVFPMVTVLEIVEVLAAHEAEYLRADLVFDDLLR